MASGKRPPQLRRTPTSTSPGAAPHQSAAGALALAFVITLAAQALPAWHFLEFLRLDLFAMEGRVSFAVFRDCAALLFGLVLALSAPGASGLRLGNPLRHLRGLALVCGGPVLLCALVYPQLPERPFTGAPWTMWAVSPLAQDLVFIGYIYGLLIVGLSRQWTGSILYAVLTHMAVNAIAWSTT